MKILIVGSNPRTGSPVYPDKHIVMSGLMRDAFNAAGHEATIARWWDDPLGPDQYDLIYVGLSSPLALSSSHLYSALRVIARMWNDDRLRLFLDNPDVRVLKNSYTGAIKDPERLWSDVMFQRANFYDVVTGPGHEQSQQEIREALNLLHSETSWRPVLYFPMYPWGDQTALMSKWEVSFPYSVGIDFTQCMLQTWEPKYRDLPESFRAHADNFGLVNPYWIAEGFDTKKAEKLVPVLNNAVRVIKKTPDMARMYMYMAEQMIGVIEHDVSSYGHGWWSPRAAMAALVGKYYFTDWRSMSGMVDSEPYYRFLPSAAEELSPEERASVAKEQYAALMNSTWTPEQTLDMLTR